MSLFSVCEACGVLPSKKLGFDPAVDPEVMTLADAIDSTVIGTARAWERRTFKELTGESTGDGASRSRDSMRREFNDWKSGADPESLALIHQMAGG